MLPRSPLLSIILEQVCGMLEAISSHCSFHLNVKWRIAGEDLQSYFYWCVFHV
jgi:hypothetical protein